MSAKCNRGLGDFYFSVLLKWQTWEVVTDVVFRDDPVFEHLFIDLEYILSQNTVLLDETRKGGSINRKNRNENSMRKNQDDSSCSRYLRPLHPVLRL